MQQEKYVAYFRVSTQKQGLSGLGIEAQQHAVFSFLNGNSGILIATYTETETGKGANPLDTRHQLKAALDTCRKHKATLIIAKLDRLARNVHFVTGLMEAGCDFVAADMPHANKVMIQMHAVMSEWERDQISARTKAALSAAKARGVVLGATGRTNLKQNVDARRAAANALAERLSGVLQGFKAAGLTQRQMTSNLNLLGIRAAAGGEWSLAQVQRVLKRINKH